MPRPKRGAARGTYRTFGETLRGLKTTMARYVEGPKTIQYPEEKVPVYPRFRGRHKLHRFEDTGLEKCVGCSLCAAACPADCIRVVAAENTPDNRVSAGERYAAVYEINLSRCIFCGYCETACPFDAITMGHDFEMSRLQPLRPHLHQGDAARGAPRAHAAALRGRVIPRYFEDFRAGERFELGRRTLTREEIIAFATEWDPQAFHTGERDSAFGEGVIASGVHTIAVWMRMFVDSLLRDTAVIAGKEVERMRMLRPVRPGMELVARPRSCGSRRRTAPTGGSSSSGACSTPPRASLVWEQRSETVVTRRPTQEIAETTPDPVTVTLQVPESEALEDALWGLDEDGPVVVSAIVPADGVVSVVVEGDLPATS